MAQKDKVKELVGRGLHSYHTKSLQQMDRIEKKNKEQNHKISILSNELDNDYLTKTEEGSIISLEHSKEGMVYLDELQGNTLVNYCTDGSKELTLNGDIDVEGIFVTTTEGVDNGLVDVMCEGNTLVNIANEKTVLGTMRDKKIIITPSKLYSQFSVTHQELMNKLNTTYTIRMEVLSNTSTVPLVANKYNGTFNGWNGVEVGFTGEKIFTYTTGSEYQFTRWFWIENNVVGEGEVEIRLTILEGDWLDKEIPPYFEGMKSVGQDDENGHKIEILSQNKNLFDKNNITLNKQINLSTGIIENSTDYHLSSLIIVKPNTPYIRTLGNAIYYYDINMNYLGYLDSGVSSPSNARYARFILRKEVEYTKEQIEEGTTKTTYVEPKLNKKEILLNEPLRGLPNGVKDRFVKIGGKLFIERNCGTEVFDGSENWNIYNDASDSNNRIRRYTNRPINAKKPSDNSVRNYMISDRLRCPDAHLDAESMSYNNAEYCAYISYGTGTFSIILPSSVLTSNDTDGFKQWLQSNPTTIIYQLEAPIYEPLEINPELICYNDTTHISNNSIIPCNMKIKNSGYNVIIKPSTLYTIELDTNKSGTIGMNLGGAKGTTTNNVLTLTTPATLTDDSLRLYGKGIKGSKVRLLEGDKTNWMPSHFEGMKSSFEDKFDATDNTYKMEILSNNKNYFNYKGELNQYYKGMSIGTEVNINTLQSDGGIFSNLFTANHHGRGQIIKVKPYTSYIIKSTVVNSGRININTPSMVNFEYGAVTNGKLNKTFNTLNNNEICLSFHTYGNPSNPNAIFYDVELILESNDNLDYIPNKSNKIQFSSIEPLRSVNLRDRYVKDKLILKDGKLVIERNCKKIVLDGTQVLSKYADQSKDGTSLFGTGDLTPERPSYHVECDSFGSSGSNLMTTTRFANIEGIGCWSAKKNFNIRIKTCRLKEDTGNGMMEYVRENPITIIYPISEPTYEEVPFELQKIILEGYENGTIYFDTNIPPTSTITYAGETPIVKSVKLNKTEVLNNTNDINDNIVPYLMDMDYRVVCLQLQSENINDGVSMARLFGGVYEMLQRDIQSKRYSIDEYRHRLDAYLGANKITEDEYNKLGDMLNE